MLDLGLVVWSVPQITPPVFSSSQTQFYLSTFYTRGELASRYAIVRSASLEKAKAATDLQHSGTAAAPLQEACPGCLPSDSSKPAERSKGGNTFSSCKVDSRSAWAYSQPSSSRKLRGDGSD